MNGEMFQIASIVAASKKAMQSNEPIAYFPATYENHIKFAFLPQMGFWGMKQYTAPNVSAWFEQIRKNQVTDVKLLCPCSVEDRGLLGFSNTTQSSILCFHRNGKVTYFVANWKFSSVRKKWNILYSEHELSDPPSGKPQFENNTDLFREVLLSIRELAVKIECENFARVFSSAIDFLDGSGEYPDRRKFGLELPQIPQKNLQIFEAASMADVFGVMGSWNDSPRYMAHEKGLDKEYEALSDDLLKNIRLAILYAINEW